MRAVRFTQTGGPEVLELADVQAFDPRPGQIRVRNQAVGINFIDTYQRAGLYPVKMPSGLGSEGAGVVEAIGEGVTRVAVGDLVGYASAPLGAYAEAHVLPAERAVRLPDGMDARTAAAAMLKGMTVEYLIRRCYPVQAGDKVLVHAAAGGVGSIMVQWLKHIGAIVIGTVGSAAKAERAKAHGADHVINYGEQDVAAQVKEITGGTGVAVAYDSVGKATFEGTLGSLGRRGMFVSFGNASGPSPAIDPLRLMRGGSLYFTRPTGLDYATNAAEVDESAGALFDLIVSGVIKVEIGQAFPLAEVRRAHEALESRQTLGSSLLIP